MASFKELRKKATDDMKKAYQVAVADFERAYLIRLLESHGGNVASASREARLSPSGMHLLIARYGLKHLTSGPRPGSKGLAGVIPR